MADPATDPDGVLAVALRYAACGLRVLPIKPGTKRPPMREWVDAATTDPDIIRNWYTEPLYRDHGVGLALGRQPDGRLIFALDVDEHDPAHSGGETLAELTEAHGSLPDTACSITGAGGQHLLFTAPVEVRNGVAGDGLDVRGEGGQIVVYPTIHPTTGRRYEWEDGCAPWDHDIVEAPSWLVAIVSGGNPLAPAPTPVAASPALVPGPLNDPDSPAEWLRSWWQWEWEIERAGWVEHHRAGNGDIHYTRPGKDRRSGESAVLHPGGPFVVFSTDATMTELRAVGRPNRDGSVTLSPFEFYAAYEHGGNLSAAALFLIAKMPGADSRLSTPADENPLARYLGQAIDWDAFWADDHSGEDWVAEPVFAAGRLTVMYAPAKMGKSEIALALVAAVATGRPILGRPSPGPRHVVYLDYEMTKGDLQERLDLLGYDENADLSHLHYYLLPSLPPLDTAEGATVMRQIAAHHDAEIVVIDTMGRAVEGDENSNDTYRAFARHTGLGLKADGVAVVRTDHAGKEREKGQRGASAKNDDADVVFRIDRVEQGWKLQRTHTRIGWVPETILIDRTETSDKRLLIELAPMKTTPYVDGTREYVAELTAAGITVDITTKKAQFAAMAKAAGLSRRSTVMGDALRWMKGQIPRFSGGPTPIEPTVDDVR